MKKNSGFTLLELLVTVSIIGIVMAIGVPAMSTFTLNDRLTTQVNTMVGHLAYARSEAVKRTQPVSICVSNNATNCTGGNWQDGWIVYVDADNDNFGDPDLFQTADIIVLNCPLTPQTQNAVSDHELSLMKNTARAVQFC